jgi:hypothetical protein
MAKPKRDLLEVLRLELEFLKNGGYRNASSWRPRFIFEDSPTCLHYGNPEPKRPCSECVLMQMVPAAWHQVAVPCRYIPLNEKDETIHSLYQYGTSEELESKLGEWLMNTIQKLELERAQAPFVRNGLPPKKSA